MGENSKGKYTIIKWIAGILGVIILLLGAASIYLSSHWKPLLSEKLKQGVHDGSGGLYSLDFNDIHLNLVTGSAVLDSVTLLPDTSIFNKLKIAGAAPANLYEIRLKQLKISRVAIIKAYFKKIVELNSIVLDNPSINITHYNFPKKPDTVKESKTLYELISKNLKSIHIDAIKIVDADVDYINGATAKPLNTVKHLSIHIDDLLIDSVSQYDKSRFYFAKDISFALVGYRSTGKDKMYTIKVDSVRGSALGQNIKVVGIQMIPLHPDLAFTRMYKYGKDRYDLKFSQINFAGVDFLKLNADGKLHAKAVTIGPAKVNIFVNRELPPPPGLDKVRNFPHIALKRLPIPTVIDTLKLRGLDVAYTEYNPISQKRGTIYFQDFGGNIYHLTNDSLALIKNNHAIAKLHAMVMKTSRLDVTIDFNLTAKDAAFKYSGKVGPMNMRVLNTVGTNMGLVEIESGQMQKTEFNITANKYGSTGTVGFYYNNLKIKLLKEGENGEKAKEKGFLSFIANSFLIKDDNPKKGDPARIANIKFIRTPAASFFNLLWKSVFLGIRENVGLGIIAPKTPEQAMQKVKDKKEERKTAREKRKEERRKEKEKKRKAKDN
ncbi:MAG: hypothetical protein V4687_10960 [Bacteroidota bacterium]